MSLLFYPSPPFDPNPFYASMLFLTTKETRASWALDIRGGSGETPGDKARPPPPYPPGTLPPTLWVEGSMRSMGEGSESPALTGERSSDVGLGGCPRPNALTDRCPRATSYMPAQ